MKFLLLPLCSLYLIFSYSAAGAEAERVPAFKVGSTTSAGQGYLTEAIGASGDHPVGTEEMPASVYWAGGFTFERAPVGAGVTNKSNTFDGSVGYRQAVDAGGGFSVSSTPAENLKSGGLEVWLGWIFSFGGNDDFQPTIEPKVEWKGQTYKQSFSGTSVARKGSRRTVTRPVSGTESIHQNQYTLSLDISPLRWISATLSGSSYSYDKDVNRFIGLLDSPRAVSSGASGFANTLGGFPKSSAALDLSFYAGETWTFELGASRTRILSDHSVSHGARVEALKDLSDAWRVGLGFDHEQSEHLGQENLTVLDLAYRF